MDLSYSQLRNITCPIRHYFTLLKSKGSFSFKPAMGQVIHDIYKLALKNRDFNEIDVILIKDILKKNSCRTDSCELIKKHIHPSIIKKLPKKLFIEQNYCVQTNRLPHISSIIDLYCKPDISYIQNNVGTIIEIKTGDYKKYDPMQLHYYAWILSISNSNVRHLVTKVFYTSSNELIVIDTLSREEIQVIVDRYFSSSAKSYQTLGISNFKETPSVISNLIDTNSNKLTSLFSTIHPEQCASCNSSIICPAYLKEVTKTFENKMSNVLISDKLIQCN